MVVSLPEILGYPLVDTATMQLTQNKATKSVCVWVFYCYVYTSTVKPWMLACSLFRLPNKTESKGHEYQLQAKIAQYYYSISNCMVLICQNERGENNFLCKVANF